MINLNRFSLGKMSRFKKYLGVKKDDATKQKPRSVGQGVYGNSTRGLLPNRRINRFNLR